MSDTCPRTTGNRARALARSLEACDDVLGADVLDPNEGPHAEWTVEAALTADRIPARIVSELAEADAAILQAPMRAPGVHQLVVSL